MVPIRQHQDLPQSKVQGLLGDAAEDGSLGPDATIGFRTGSPLVSRGAGLFVPAALSIASSLFAHAACHVPSTPLLRCS